MQRPDAGGRVLATAKQRREENLVGKSVWKARWVQVTAEKTHVLIQKCRYFSKLHKQLVAILTGVIKREVISWVCLLRAETCERGERSC